MCEAKTRAQNSTTIPRPQWRGLYALAFLMLGALAAAEVLDLPQLVKTALDCGLTLGGFGAIAVWRRWNRAALDQQAWCDCAGASMTVRVILSRRPQPMHVEVRVDETLEPVAGHATSLGSSIVSARKSPSIPWSFSHGRR